MSRSQREIVPPSQWEKVLISDQDLCHLDKIVITNALEVLRMFLQGDFAQLVEWYHAAACFPPPKARKVRHFLRKAEEEAKHHLLEAHRALHGESGKCLPLLETAQKGVMAESLRQMILGNWDEANRLRSQRFGLTPYPHS